MIELYRRSFRYFIASLPALVLFAAMLEAGLWFFQPKSETGITFITLTIVAYYFHRHFLFGESLGLMNKKPPEGAPPLKFGRFILVSGALLFIPVGVAIILSFQLLPANTPSKRLIGAMGLLFFGFYLIALSFFGTALPAAVAKDGTYRMAQGIKAGFSTMWRLLVGPTLIGGLLLATTVWANTALTAADVQPTGLLELAYFTLLRTLGFLPTILAVAVLCEMYHRTRPALMPSPNQPTGTALQPLT